MNYESCTIENKAIADELVKSIKECFKLNSKIIIIQLFDGSYQIKIENIKQQEKIEFLIYENGFYAGMIFCKKLQVSELE